MAGNGSNGAVTTPPVGTHSLGAPGWRARVGRARARLGKEEWDVLDRLYHARATSRETRCPEGTIPAPPHIGWHVLRGLQDRGFLYEVEAGRFYIDEAQLAAAVAGRRSAALAAAVAAAHLALGLAGALLLRRFCPAVPGAGACAVQTEVFTPLAMQGATFFGALFTTGVVLYALAAAVRGFGPPRPSVGRRVVGIAALSAAVSVLLAIDAQGRATTAAQLATGAAPAPGPDSFWGVAYALLTERQAVSLLALVVAATLAVAAYHAARALLTVEYEGAGIQIRLPGQTVYYVPLYPQISWQNTRIAVRSGERMSIEVSGYVSPGALGSLDALRDHMRQYLAWSAQYGEQPRDASGNLPTEALEAFRRIPAPGTWDYSGPAGYPEAWYDPKGQPEFLRSHELYRKPYYYQRDQELTVTGLPHNVVVGKIVAPGEPRPSESRPDQPGGGYDYGRPEHRRDLLNLSSRRYPIDVEATKSGELWAVINDVDIARWDNTGMFFLKITRHAWL
jgi:hypothetical protein